MKILLPFFDDSSLFFALRMRDLIIDEVEIIDLIFLTHDEIKLSERQIQENLKGLPFLQHGFLKDFLDKNSDYDAVITAKVTRDLFLYKKRRFKKSLNTKIIVFQPGLEFTPQQGIKVRKYFDVLFLNNQEDCKYYHDNLPKSRNISIYQGHPYFIKPEAWLPLDNKKDVVFFAQAISPLSYNGRLHILNMLNTLAKLHPERKIILKLRHLPEENKKHPHKEKFSYPDLLADLDHPQQDNFILSAASMQEVLANAGFSITCTSTAAMDSISAGIPTAIYLDYVENYYDKYSFLMKSLFIGSNVILSLKDILELKFDYPDKDWLEENIVSREELIKRIKHAIKEE